MNTHKISVKQDTCKIEKYEVFFRMKKGVVELSNMFKKENESLQELNMKAKQIKEALETA